MAQRRMFSLQVVDTDKFMDMPLSARLLYYELGMRADDDGFVASVNRIARTVGCSKEDITTLTVTATCSPLTAAWSSSSIGR